MNKTTTVLKRIALFALALFATNEANAQLSVSYGLTPTQLVQNILVGTGVTVSNVTYNGDTSAIAKFVGTGSNIGFSSGVMLSTGRADGAVGANPYPIINSTDFFTTSTDPELTAIASGALNDAAILEFDFVTVSDSIKFRYVFASEEYPDYVCSIFNDVFGFFISGPNPGGGNYVNQNVALIPGTALAVAINTVNPGVAGANSGGGACTSLAYSSLYNNNIGGTTVSFNGFTVPIIAKAPVTCGQTYHIKIAISDVGDAAFDSGVFLEAGSFSSSAVQIVPQISYGGPNDSTLFEGCGTACIHFVRTTNLAHADTVNLAIAGTATNGVDYNTGVPGTLLPTQLIFQPGQDSLTYCINAVSDGITEGLETILFTITQTGPCATTTTNATLYINEHSPLTLTVRNDTTFCNFGAGGTLTLNTTVTGGVEPYTYTWTGGAASVADPVVTVSNTTQFVVTVNDACTGIPDPTPSVTDSVLVTVLNLPAVTVNISSHISYGGVNDTILYEGCGTNCLHFIRTSNSAVADTLTITVGGVAQNGMDYYYGTPGIPMPTQLIFPIGIDTVIYCINANADGITEGMESVNLSIFQSNPCVTLNTGNHFSINEHHPITVSTRDTILCNQGGTVTLNTLVNGGVSPYSYSWTNGAAPTSNPIVNVATTTTYFVTVNDACTGTPDPTPAITDSIKVNVILSNSMSINAGKDVLVCPGDLVNLTSIVTGGGAPFIYHWSTSSLDTLTSVNTSVTSLIANIGGLYIVTVHDFCNNVRLDSVNVDVHGSCALTCPNVVSPDGRGPSINDLFYIQNLENFPGSSLVIFNRWGKKLYETSNYQNDWNGSKYSEGTYYYVLTVSDGRSIPGFFQIVKGK